MPFAPWFKKKTPEEVQARTAARERPAAQAAQPTYTTTGEQKGAAQDLVDKPDALRQLSELPQYGAATQKTVMDPDYYSQKWDTASDEIGEQYSKKGGFYDRMMGNLNERGLAGSGEYNAQTNDMGQDLATQLSRARQGIEGERMQHQYGADESYAGRMGNIMGMQSGRDVQQQGMDWDYNRTIPGVAGGLSGELNDLITGEYDRAAEAERSRQYFENEKFGTVERILRGGDFPDDNMDWYYDMMGVPRPAQSSGGGYTPYQPGSNPSVPNMPGITPQIPMYQNQGKQLSQAYDPRSMWLT